MGDGMKVLILGFDGLEHRFVEKWKLDSLKQDRFGKVGIPEECFKEAIDPFGNRTYEPWTPYVWSSIVTGKTPDVVGISLKNVQRWQNTMLQTLRGLSERIGLTRHKATRFFFDGRGKALERIGFRKEHFNLMENSKVPTIFHAAKNPETINVPLVYQARKNLQDEEHWKLKLKGEGLEEMRKHAWKDFKRISKKTLETVKKGDWDLMMSYVRFLDTIGELSFGSFKEMFKAYSASNHYAKQVRDAVSDNVACLIVSDHGMRRLGKTKYGSHSDYAFYSLNIETDWKPLMVTDFYKKIVEWVSQPSA